MLLRMLIAVSLAATSWSCGLTDPGACTTSIEPGIVVTIRDAIDGTPLAETASGNVYDGTYVGPLVPYGFLGDGTMISRKAADERPGRYTVAVTHPGYREWRVENVVVRAGECHVRTVDLLAELQR